MAAVGWLLATVRRRRASLATRPSGGHSTLRRWHLALAAAVGYKLLRAGLARAAGQPCYLETATPSNVGLYQAHGFAVRNEWQHDDAPNFWSMWHPGSVTAAVQ